MIGMKEIHKAFCKRRKIKYVPANVDKDLRWNCHEVATILVELLSKEGKEARAVYGFWHGECVGRSMPFHRHGWTLVGKEIWDATRFVFEGKKPYLFKGNVDEHDEYDEGMRRAKAAMRAPFPIPGQGKIHEIEWRPKTYMFLAQLIKSNSGRIVDPSKLNAHQLMWVANTDYLALGDHITDIYTKLDDLNLRGFIPVDYWQWWEANK